MVRKSGYPGARPNCCAVPVPSVGVVHEAAPVRHAPGERQVLAFVVGERLAGPVDEAERQAQEQAGDGGGDDQPARARKLDRHAGRYWRPSKRSAEICSDTRPTRNTTAANRISSTDPLGILRLHRDRPDGVRRAEQERGGADRQEHAQRAEERDDLEDDHQELRAVAGQPDLGRADARPRLDRLERDVVARLDERQRGRGRRREPVRQQVQELAQVLAARRPEAGRQVRDLPLGQVAREPVERGVAEPPRLRGLRGARARADHEIGTRRGGRPVAWRLPAGAARRRRRSARTRRWRGGCRS